MVAPSALLAIQDGSGSIEDQGQGYIQELSAGDVAKFTLQSIAGITPTMRWTLVLESHDTPNLNLSFSWSPNNSGLPPEFDVNLPPSPFTARYVTTIYDLQNALSQFTGEIIANPIVAASSPARLASQFGAAGDATIFVGTTVVGTPDEVALQNMLDANRFGQVTSPPGCVSARLNATTSRFDTGIVQPATGYRIRCPLILADVGTQDIGNYTLQLDGEAGAQSGLVALDFQGPAVIAGNAGDANSPSPVLDPSGSGEWCMAIGVSAPPLETTIASGSNNVTLPTATINLASTAALTTAGQVFINIGGAAQRVTYSGISGNALTGCTGGTGTLLTGQSVGVSPPQWNLSDGDLGDLSGWTNFTWEYFVNPCNFREVVAAVGANFQSSIFGSGGQVGDLNGGVLTHSTFLEQWVSSASSIFGLSFQLTTANGQFTVNTSTTVDHGPPANALSHIAITYDGAHLRMFINGAQPDASMTVSATGALAQEWYEALSIASGANTQWPFQPTTLFNCPRVLLGRSRLSNICRYTAPFTPPTPSQVVCENGNTRCFLPFDPVTVNTYPSGWQSPSFPARATLRAYQIAQCGTGVRIGFVENGVGFPVWLYNRTLVTDYISQVRIRNMFIQSWGECVHTFSTLDSEIGEDSVFLTANNAIVIDNFSYNTGVGAGAFFKSCGMNGPNGMSAEMYFSYGSQFSYVRERWQSAGSGCQFSVVCAFADLTIAKGSPNTYQQGVFAFTQTVSSIIIDASPVDDGGPGYKLCVVLWVPADGGGANLQYRSGYIGVDVSTCPVVLIGTPNTNVDFNVPVFSSNNQSYIFSFQGRASVAAGHYVIPATAHVLAPGPKGFCDPANPGPVRVPELLNEGPMPGAPNRITPSTNAGIVLDIASGQAQYKYYEIETGGWSGTQPVTWPANPMAVYVVHNKNAQTANLTRLGSSSPVACTSGTTITVYDNGTDLVAA